MTTSTRSAKPDFLKNLVEVALLGKLKIERSTQTPLENDFLTGQVKSNKF